MKDLKCPSDYSPPRDFSDIVEDMSEYFSTEMNGAVYIHDSYPYLPEWAKPIVKAFHQEFGEHTEYWYE